MKATTTFSLLAGIAAQTVWALPSTQPESKLVKVEARDDPVVPLSPDWYRCDSRDISPMRDNLHSAASAFWNMAGQTCDRPGEAEATQMYNRGKFYTTFEI